MHGAPRIYDDLVQPIISSSAKLIYQEISEVFYVPELKNNLLSIGQLQEKGLTILFQHGKCKIFHPEKGKLWKLL